MIIKNYSDKILHHISLSLAKDENLIILGSNGAGKSTLAKVMCGIIPSKSVKLNSKNRSKEINYIPCKLEIFDEYITVRAYLELSKLYSDIDVNSAIEALDLQELADSFCKTLSSGEQQRILLASSLLHGANITIYDEPTANLDPNRTIQIYNLLKSDKIKQRIVITHDLTLAYRLGYRIIYMQRGEIAFEGTNQAFFEAKNLNSFFGSSVKKIDNSFVVNL